MRSNSPKTRQVTVPVVLFCLGALSGCESARDLTLTQGTGENLFAISDFQDQSFQTNTTAKRFKGQTSRADELVTLDGFDLINNLDAVELAFTEGLFADLDLKDLIFYARDNHAYTFQYGFTDHYVILSKVAPRADIPSQEMTYAEELGDDLYKVPVMGVPIALYTVEAVEDVRGKDTRKLDEFPKDYLSDATHFRMDLSGVKYFSAPGKQDLFPVEYFNPDDEWFFTKTLVGRPIDSQAILGSTLSALKIKLVRTNNSIIGVDLNIAPEQEVLDPTKTITVLEFPVEWTDFRLERSGNDAFLKETKLGNQEPTSRFWRDRAYALLDFNNADRLDQAFTLDNKLELLEIGNDYLSFNIYESGSGNTYKYSLSKVNEVVQGQKFFADDALLFHIFKQKRTVIGGELFEQTPDIENIVTANRFFPGDDGEIIYHLSENSFDVPEFVEAARIAVKAWDTAFDKAGTGIKLRFDEERVQLGDVRYNQIVLYGYEIDSSLASGGMLLGFGPSVQDTRSGETYSAATHIYLRAYREGLISNIRSFVRNEIGLYDDKIIASFSPGGAPGGGGDPNGRSDELEGTVANLDFLGSSVFAGDPERVARLSDRIIHSPNRGDKITAYRESLNTQALHPTTRQCRHGNVAANSTNWEKIRQTCLGDNDNETELKQYLEDLKAAHLADPETVNIAGEEEAILACAQPLMKDLLTSTLIHELGHNLGLGHNFAASSDGRNHAKLPDGSTAYPSSSVMDYPDRDYDLYSQAGPYDIAAIAYLYARTIETADGETIPIPDGMSAADAAQAEGKEIKPYRMCTDYEFAGWGNMPEFDPLCIKWDVGADPEAYVEWAIQKIHADIVENGYRYNQAAFFGGSSSTSYFSHFRQIHDYFRYLLQAQAGLYFEKIAAGDFNVQSLYAVMDRTRDPVLTKQYYAAVKAIFEFSRKLLRLPSRICLLEDSTADPAIVDLFEFKDLRDRIFDRENTTVQNCSEALPRAQAVLADLGAPHDLTGKEFTDRGIEIDGLQLDLDPEAASAKLKQYDFTTHSNEYWYPDDNPLYSSGMLELKIAALRTLFWRMAGVMAITASAQVENITFVDIPWFRDALFDDAFEVITQGIAGAEIDERLEAGGQRFGHYREYEDIYWMWLLSLYDSVADQKSKAYSHAVSMVPLKETSQSGFAQTLEARDDIWWLHFKNSYYLFESDSSSVGQLIRTWVQIDRLPAVLAVREAIDANPAVEEAKIDVTGVANAEQLEAVATNYLGSHGLSLQPPQLEVFRAMLPAPGADAATLLGMIRTFLDDEVCVSPILAQMVERGDWDNIASLKAIILNFLSQVS